MSNDIIIQTLTEKIQALISTDPDVFLVEIKIKPTNNIKIYLDGDQGVSIERLVQFNRRLYKQLEEEDLFPGGDFSLEVSSPGVDEPLKLHRQYIKNCGRFVEIILNDGTKKEGKLVTVNNDVITVEEQKARLTGKNKNKEVGQGKEKKLETVTHTVALIDIKTTKIQIKF
ncbi:MAG: ribosome maturation factor [Chitinophagaceae bacterium]|nr:ribosome maturation factor [Chitinophagaceae bacterium]MBK8953684.1 ribosome maturation factor [Chitinophagaceae bacterium]